MSALRRRPTKATFTGPHLRVLADIIRNIADADVREIMANHFGQEFARRSGSFDPSAWSGATGGKLTGPVRLKVAP